MRRKNSRFRLAAGALLAVSLALVSAYAVAGVVNSPHDISLNTGLSTKSSTAAPGGVCSACHLPHSARYKALWARPLSGSGNYDNVLTLDGATSATLNYRPSTTLLCYDCHDYHFAGGVPASYDNISLNVFATSHKPQNIAFGFQTAKRDGISSFDSGSTMKEDPPAGSYSGYYENSPPYASNYGANPALASRTDNVALAKTGGHYFKSGDPNGAAGGVYKGDKLPCNDCHDPHKWSSNWQAFFSPRIQTSNSSQWTSVFNNPALGSSTTPVGSSYMANPLQSGASRTPNDQSSRKMCIVCHGTSTDSATVIPPVRFSEVNPTYTLASPSTIVRPSLGISEHQSVSTVPCVSCHQHNAIDASCSMCHGFPPSNTSSSPYPLAFTPTAPVDNDSHARHVGNKQGASKNSFDIYAFPCGTCHYGSAMGIDSSLGQHQNGKVSVVIQGSWTKQGTGYDNTNYYNQGFMSGNLPSGTLGQLDNGTTNTGWAVAAGRRGGNSCRNVYCHSAGRVVSSMVADNLTDFPRPVWASGGVHCNDCHGVGTDNTTSGGLAYGMPNYPNAGPNNGRANSHLAHVSKTGIECSVCHSGTVTGTLAARDILPTIPTLHVNGLREVSFDGLRAVGGGTPYTGSNKSCQVSCHGGGVPLWGDNLVTSCTSCHTSQGSGTSTVGFTGPHQVHTDNSAAHRYRFACEQCHALRATGGAPNNTVHANGDDNTAGPSYAEVRFTDNAGTAWSYGTSPNLFETVNTKINPYLGAAVAPSYLDNATSGGTDPLNSPNLTWSTGTCGNVWCHSNANPASAGGGANTYRTPRWTGTAACNACHLNRDTFANMGAAADRMSMGHQYHLATDRYGITCDECHANTVANDCTAAILDPGGFPFHVNGVKTDIKGSTTLENTAINDNTLAYDGAGRTCSNTYCHSNGKRQAAPFAARLAPPAWNVAPAYSCATNPCHASTGGTAAASFAADTPVDNSAHLAHPYGCNACHVSTTADNATVASYALHVNGVKDVTINALFDSDANPANNYTLVSKTCAGIACHGGKPVAWTDNVTSCDACHTTTNGVAVTANAYDYTFSTSGAPNMSKVSPSLFTARGHGASAALPWTGGTNPSTLFGRAMVCTDCHNMSVPHGTAGNPFRFLATVNGKAVTFDNVDTLCFACHNAAAVQRHAKAVTGGGSSLWEHNQRCVDCHDVHGQSNIFMVYDSIVWQDNGATAYATSDGYGVPYNPTLRTTVSFTATTAGSNFAGSGAYNGICEVCHERTAQYQRNNALGKGGAVSHPTSVCTACHKHEAGFKGGGCKGCHGPDQTIAGAPDVGAYWATKGHGSPAVTTLMGRAIECEDCHDVGYLTSADHKTNVAGTPPTNINTYNYPGKTIGTDTQTNGNTSHLKAAFLNTSASTRADVARTFDNYCMNASCHKTLTQHRHVQPPGDVMRFGDNNTVANPKLYNWLAYSNFPSTYPTDFYRTLSPWIDSDIRVSGLADTTNYGLCITCHDPHGTPVTDNTHTGNATLGYTNHMLRGNWATDPAGFCNKACHTTRTPP